LLLGLILLAALVAARTCGSADRNVDADEAVELALAEASFEPCPEIQCRQRRFVQRGIPPRGFWLVGLAAELDTDGRPTRTESFLVDTVTGDVRPAR
jgi:hypothetical protein